MSGLNEHVERWRSHEQPRRVDYTRPGFVRPADLEPCPNDHGPDGVIACWSPGGPCPAPNDPACETCGPCFRCTDRPEPEEA